MALGAQIQAAVAELGRVRASDGGRCRPGRATLRIHPDTTWEITFPPKEPTKQRCRGGALRRPEPFHASSHSAPFSPSSLPPPLDIPSRLQSATTPYGKRASKAPSHPTAWWTISVDVRPDLPPAKPSRPSPTESIRGHRPRERASSTTKTPSTPSTCSIPRSHTLLFAVSTYDRTRRRALPLAWP